MSLKLRCQFLNESLHSMLFLLDVRYHFTVRVVVNEIVGILIKTLSIKVQEKFTSLEILDNCNSLLCTHLVLWVCIFWKHWSLVRSRKSNEAVQIHPLILSSSSCKNNKINWKKYRTKNYQDSIANPINFFTSCYYFNKILMHAIKALNFACQTDNVNWK